MASTAVALRTTCNLTVRCTRSGQAAPVGLRAVSQVSFVVRPQSVDCQRRQKVVKNKRMALTSLQKIVLQRYKGYRSQPPTFMGVLKQSWRGEVILVAASALVAWFAYSSHLYALAYFIVGMLVGTLARDVGTFRRVLQVWPALSQVLDWHRVDEVLDQEEAD
jgi:hypothetical protein